MNGTGESLLNLIFILRPPKGQEAGAKLSGRKTIPGQESEASFVNAKQQQTQKNVGRG